MSHGPEGTHPEGTSLLSKYTVPAAILLAAAGACTDEGRSKNLAQEHAALSAPVATQIARVAAIKGDYPYDTDIQTCDIKQDETEGIKVTCTKPQDLDEHDKDDPLYDATHPYQGRTPEIGHWGPFQMEVYFENEDLPTLFVIRGPDGKLLLRTTDTTLFSFLKNGGASPSIETGVAAKDAKLLMTLDAVTVRTISTIAIKTDEKGEFKEAISLGGIDLSEQGYINGFSTMHQGKIYASAQDKVTNEETGAGFDKMGVFEETSPGKWEKTGEVQYPVENWEFGKYRPFGLSNFSYTDHEGKEQKGDVIAVSHGKTVKIYEPGDLSKPVKTFACEVDIEHLKLHPNGLWLLGSGPGGFTMFNIETGQTVHHAEIGGTEFRIDKNGNLIFEHKTAEAGQHVKFVSWDPVEVEVTPWTGMDGEQDINTDDTDADGLTDIADPNWLEAEAFPTGPDTGPEGAEIQDAADAGGSEDTFVPPAEDVATPPPEDADAITPPPEDVPVVEDPGTMPDEIAIPIEDVEDVSEPPKEDVTVLPEDTEPPKTDAEDAAIPPAPDAEEDTAPPTKDADTDGATDSPDTEPPPINPEDFPPVRNPEAPPVSVAKPDEGEVTNPPPTENCATGKGTLGGLGLVLGTGVVIGGMTVAGRRRKEVSPAEIAAATREKIAG